MDWIFQDTAIASQPIGDFVSPQLDKAILQDWLRIPVNLVICSEEGAPSFDGCGLIGTPEMGEVRS